MDRYTQKTVSGKYLIGSSFLESAAGGFEGPAADRLAAFERVYRKLTDDREKTEQEMEALRQKGKTGSATFRQLMARKVNLGNILDLFDIYGIQ